MIFYSFKAFSICYQPTSQLAIQLVSQLASQSASQRNHQQTVTSNQPPGTDRGPAAEGVALKITHSEMAVTQKDSFSDNSKFQNRCHNWAPIMKC